ncbi:MAG: ParB N-terminal domain-containing protein [Nitrososphaerales archaeon]
MSEIEIKLAELNDNPWRFKVISAKDFNNLVNTITTYGSHATNPILVAKIEGKFYIVDGHARRDAVAEAGFDKVRCIVAEWIRNLNDLRIWAFRLNRHGHYNPLALLRMVKEDIEALGSVEKVSAYYGVSSEYVNTLLKLDALDDSAKAMVDKVIDIARKRYQFVLEQIDAYHLANIAELEPEKQLEVLEWLFHDIIYGPPNESLVSLPSIYEVINEIDRHKSVAGAPNVVHKKYRTKDHSLHGADHLEFKCSCGNRFHVDFFTGKVYEYVEQDYLIIKKEVELSDGVLHEETNKSKRNQQKRIAGSGKLQSINT